MNPFLPRLVAGVAFALLATGLCAAQEQDGIGRFEIAGFQVEGNSLLDTHAIKALLAPHTGEQRDFGDVQRALEALEAAYRERGYNMVQVVLPEQELNRGVVRLQVIETRIGIVRLEGNRQFDDANVRASLPGLREGEAPNLARISNSLKLANQNPAKKTTLRLQAGALDDEVDAVVKVEEDKPWRIGASIDNSGNDTTGKTLLTTQFRHANVAGRDHVLSLQYSTTLEHPNQISVYGVGYHVPLYALGDSIDLFASHSDVESTSVLAGILTLPVSGRGTVFGARYNQNLARVGNYESALSYGIDHKAYRTAIDNLSIGDVTVRPFSLTYSGSWHDSSNVFGFGVSAIHNIAGGTRGRTADFSGARAGARPGYRIVRMNAAYSRALPSDWQARLVFAAQLSPDALVPGEQFGVGGQGTVRGFAERDITGDRGAVVNAEIYTPNLCAGVRTVAMQCRALAFFDAGSVSRHHPQAGDPYTNASISSIGLGWRMAIDRHATLEMDFGHVIDSGISKAEGDGRVHVKLAVSY